MIVSSKIEIQNIGHQYRSWPHTQFERNRDWIGLENIAYEPEQFPGLIYRLDEPSVVALLFGSGKLVITGGKQLDDAEQAPSVIKDRLSDLGLLG